MTVPRTDRNIASTKEINLNDAYQESIMTKLSILAYADDKDKDFREQIRAYGKKLPERFSVVLKEIVNKENLTLKQLSKKFNYSDKQFRVWRSGKAGIPLNLLIAVWQAVGKNLEELENLIEEIGVYGSDKIKPPKQLTLELAEIIGRHCGDGCCIKSSKDYRVTLTEHKSLIDLHNKQLKEIFDIHAKKRKITNEIYISIVNSKTYHRFFTHVIKIPAGKKAKTVKEPQIIKEAGVEFRKRFVRGLIDTEGSVYNANRQTILQISLKSPFLINSILEILKEIGLNSYVYHYKDVFTLRLFGKKQVQKYFELIGTSSKKWKSIFPGNR
jgi:intein/homing endonuclease